METDDLGSRALDGFIARVLFGYEFTEYDPRYVHAYCNNCGRFADVCKNTCNYSASDVTVGLILAKLSGTGITYRINYSDGIHKVWLRQQDKQVVVHDHLLPYALCRSIYLWMPQ